MARTSRVIRVSSQRSGASRKKRLVCEPPGSPLLDDALHQFAKQRFGTFVQHVLRRSDSEENRFGVAERSRHRRQAGAGEFQSIEPEDDLRRRLHRDLGRGRERVNARDGGGETLARGLRIHGASEPGDDVAGVGGVDRLTDLGALVEFEDLPLGGLGVQVRHALAHDLRAARRQKQLQPFDVGAAREVLALIVHPENAEGERGIHRRLRLLRIHAEHGKRRLSGAQHGAGVNRAEGMLQVGAAAEMLDLEAAIVAQQDALEHALILRSQQALQSAGAAVTVGTDFQQRWVAPGQSASRSGAGCGLSLRHRARGAPCCALPTTGAECTCLRRRRNTSRCSKSNRTSPSSTPTACGALARNCSSILVRSSGEIIEGCIAFLRA